MTDACKVVNKEISITECMNAKNTGQQCLSRPETSPSTKHQQQTATSKRRMVWERSLVIRPLEQRVGYEWEDTQQEEWIRQCARHQGGRYAKTHGSAKLQSTDSQRLRQERMRPLAMEQCNDASTLRENQSMLNAAQCQQSGNVRNAKNKWGLLLYSQPSKVFWEKCR